MTGHERQILFCLSALLRYPDEDLLIFLRDLHRGRYQLEYAPHPDVRAFITHTEATDISDLQVAYVRTFDLDAAANLHLTWHVYGDSPRQKRFLTSLIEVYRDAGFPPLPGELPDYLPIMLEFMAAGPECMAICLRDAFGPVIAGLAKHVAEKHSPYASLLHAAADVLSPNAWQSREVCA